MQLIIQAVVRWWQRLIGESKNPFSPPDDSAIKALLVAKGCTQSGDFAIFAPMLKHYSSNEADVVLEYLYAGLWFGYGVSFLGIGGKCGGFDQGLERWIEAEKQYAALGYQPISGDAFEACAGWSKPLKGLAQLMEKGEQPIFHAQLYKEYFSRVGESGGPLQAAWNTGEAQVSSFSPPSTELAAQHKADAVKNT